MFIVLLELRNLSNIISKIKNCKLDNSKINGKNIKTINLNETNSQKEKKELILSQSH